MSAPAHVAIVGCGFAGTSALFQLVDRHPVRRITVFEATGDFGPGYAYRLDECPDYLLNNANDTVCVTPSNRRAFVEWLKTRPDLAPSLDEKGHAARAVFGAFLKDVVAAARVTAAVKGVAVELVSEEVVALEEDANGRVRLRSASRAIEADAAILTTGRCPDVDPFPHPPEGSAARYVASHVRTDALDDAPLDATVHVLGASLSAYDVINRLFSPRTGCRFEREGDGLAFRPGPNARRVVLCSRSGRLKGAQSRHPMTLTRRRFTPAALREAAPSGLSLGAVAQAIQDDVAAHALAVDWDMVRDPYGGCASAEAVDARAERLLEDAVAAATDAARRNVLVDFFADAQTDIWDLFAERALTPEAERRYRRRFETAALSFAAPCPVSTAETLLALRRAGRLCVRKGVREIHFDGDRYRIAHAYGVEEARFVINATGSVDRDVESPAQPALVRDMARRGLLRPDERDGVKSKGAAVDMRTFRLAGACNVYLANMLLWGPGFFTSSAFLMARIVEAALAAMFAPSTAGCEAADNAPRRGAGGV